MAILSRTLDDFKRKDVIVINKTTEVYPVRLSFPNAEEEDGPGAIPYGDTILSATAKVVDADGVDQTANVLDSGNATVITGNKVRVKVGHPQEAEYTPGWHTLVVTLSLTPSGAVIGYNARRLWIE